MVGIGGLGSLKGRPSVSNALIHRIWIPLLAESSFQVLVYVLKCVHFKRDFMVSMVGIGGLEPPTSTLSV